MIKIYKDIIKKYIKNITIEDIKKFSSKYNEVLTNEEALIILNYIKTYHNELLNKDTSSFIILKQNLRNDLFNKIVLLYNEYNKYI